MFHISYPTKPASIHKSGELLCGNRKYSYQEIVVSFHPVKKAKEKQTEEVLSISKVNQNISN